MFRQMIAASAITLLATGAMAQNTIDRAGTGPGSTIEANANAQSDRLNREDFNRSMADWDARWADYDARMSDYEARIMQLEQWRDEDAGVVRAGTGGDSIEDANTDAKIDRIQPSSN